MTFVSSGCIFKLYVVTKWFGCGIAICRLSSTCANKTLVNYFYSGGD